MNTPTCITLTVPLVMTLDLANEIEREARRSGQSIPEMLSLMLLEAYEARAQEEQEQAANAAMNGIPVFNAHDGPLSVNESPSVKE